MKPCWPKTAVIVVTVGFLFVLLATLVVRETGIWSDAQFAWESYQAEKRYSQALLLCEKGTTGKELAAVIGRPPESYENPEEEGIVIWRYPGASLDGAPFKVLKIYLDKQTNRVIWVGEGHIFSLRKPLTMSHVNRIKRMQWLLLKVFGDPHKAVVRKK